MSRNSNVLFSQVPSIGLQRSIINMPQKHITTFNCGELVPFFLLECVPSDSVRIKTSKVFRLQTLLTPIFDSLVADVYYFFVPNRLVWSHWKQFMGENTDSAYLPEVTYTPPKIYCNSNTNGYVDTGDVLDYMGLPVWPDSLKPTGFGCTPVAFPYRGYQLIWNEFFRDQNLQDPVNINTGDSDIYWKDVDNDDKKPLPVNKLHDYFTSALRAPAKSPSGFATAWTNYVSGPSGSSLIDPPYGLPVVTGSNRLVGEGTLPQPLKGILSYNDNVLEPEKLGNTNLASTPIGTYFYAGDNDNKNGYAPTNLWADTNGYSFGISIPALRTAFQMQKFLERDAVSGTRYQEIILSHFRCRAEDSRLQRPEYLGGNRIPLNIQQITNQAQSSGEFLGDVGAMSLTTDSHYDVEWSCCEHGFIIGLCCVRQQGHYYPQGMEHWWFRDTRESYYWPEFSHLTDQTIKNWEIFANENGVESGSYGNMVFGYQERYAEYKMRLDKVSGEMRPGISNSLASWNLADHYTSQVYLSDEWIREDKSNVDRTLAVASSVSNQIMADFYVDCKMTRPMPLHSMPGLADHF